MSKVFLSILLGTVLVFTGCLQIDYGGDENESSGCTADEVRCNGDKVEICNVAGMWTTTQNCADDDLICKEAQCVEDAENPQVELSCTYRSAEECKAYGYMSSCGNRDCITQGWNLACREEGSCEDLGSVDYGDAEATTDDYYGIWGGIFTTGSRTIGIPLRPYQDSVTVHHLLMRLSKEGDDLVIHSKMCYMQMHNFDEEKVYDIGEDLGQLVISPQYYNSVATLEHRVSNPEAFEVGASFETDWFYEVRGAKVEDHIESDLPDRQHYETYCKPWDEKKDSSDCLITDQDGDGKPGMTVLGIGALENQEVYHDQRWGTIFAGTILDNDHIEGLVDHTNLQYQLDASSASMVYDIESELHPEHERTYLRMLRMPEDATCEDVTAEVNTAGSWLEFTAFMDDVPDP